MERCRLVDDHARIRGLLARLERGEGTAGELTATLEAHLAFEEREILSRLGERLPSATGPIRTIREDHASIRAHLADLEIEALAPAALGRLASVLAAHLRMEEELVLPFAHTHFCAEELGRLGCAPAGRPLEPSHDEDR